MTTAGSYNTENHRQETLTIWQVFETSLSFSEREGVLFGGSRPSGRATPQRQALVCQGVGSQLEMYLFFHTRKINNHCMFLNTSKWDTVSWGKKVIFFFFAFFPVVKKSKESWRKPAANTNVVQNGCSIQRSVARRRLKARRAVAARQLGVKAERPWQAFAALLCSHTWPIEG